MQVPNAWQIVLSGIVSQSAASLVEESFGGPTTIVYMSQSPVSPAPLDVWVGSSVWEARPDMQILGFS